MKITVITPNWNGEKYLEESIRSVLAQRADGVELEYIFIDGGSTDSSMDIVGRNRAAFARVISEKDHGPASAINKGLRLATGDLVAWLNADDFYHPDAIARVVHAMEEHPYRALCFGRCSIVDQGGKEIRQNITRFKEAFFPISSRFTIQCINYVSQPAMFFRRSALEKAGPLREDMKAAWDYEFLLRLWRCGGAARVPGGPLAAFRWHEASISGQNFRRQFKEEFEVAARDAGRVSLQTLLHLGVRWGIVGIYSCMEWKRKRMTNDE
jgi:glycosyltransferase involved in cell wall biosynthesis